MAGLSCVCWNNEYTGGMPMKFFLNAPGNPPGPLRKIFLLLLALLLAALILTFSAVFFVVALVVGAVMWGVFWWKTRALRKQMREFAAQMPHPDSAVFRGEVFSGEIIEGEAVQVHEPRSRVGRDDSL
jgi:hypothetical protein